MISESVLKIATAAMSREIFLVNACDGVTTRYAADPSESLCHCVTSPFRKGGLAISLRRFQSLTSVR